MGNAIKHTTAVLKMPTRVKNAGTFASSIVTALTGNAYFPNPTPSLATVESDIAAYNTAEAAVLSRTKGAAEARDVKLATLRTDLDHLLVTCRGSPTPTPVRRRRSSRARE